jgi:hypothetical protein
VCLVAGARVFGACESIPLPRANGPSLDGACSGSMPLHLFVMLTEWKELARLNGLYLLQARAA